MTTWYWAGKLFPTSIRSPANVVFNGGSGTDTFTLDDSAESSSLSHLLADEHGLFADECDWILKVGTSTIACQLSERAHRSGPLSTVTVRSNSVSQTTSIDGSARVVIGTGDVSNVLERIQIVNATRATALTVMIRCATTSRNTISIQRICASFHGSPATVVTFNSAFLSSLTINGSKVQNQYNLRGHGRRAVRFG